jgi:hypothetical protein
LAVAAPWSATLFASCTTTDYGGKTKVEAQRGELSELTVFGSNLYKLGEMERPTTGATLGERATAVGVHVPPAVTIAYGTFWSLACQF